MNVELPKIECKRCGHKWNPRKADVRLCPSCKSAYFDTRRDTIVSKKGSK